jgi:hypothetical protein
MRWSRQESALLGEESVFCLALRVEGIDWLAAVVQRVIVLVRNPKMRPGQNPVP